MSQDNKDSHNHEAGKVCVKCLSNETVRPNSRYSARYARRSLENTNVRNDDLVDYWGSKMSSGSSYGSLNERHSSLGNVAKLHGNNKENRQGDATISTPDEGHAVEKRSSSSMDDRLVDSKDLSHQEEDINRQPEVNGDDHRTESTTDESMARREQDQVDKDYQDAEDLKISDNRQFEVEKSMPWLRMDPSDKNLSKQMFLYLTHKELKCKIEELAVRESHACKKQCWDEALRLRDMRNRLELIREKKLYNLETLDLDEETRRRGLMNISKRENELAEREDVCRDSTMYSEDAKALWKQWVQEDGRSTIGDARLQREKLMNSLEKEWQGLAIRDKEQITQSYQMVMNDSSLQKEHKLAATINETRMKPSASPSK